MAFDPVLPEMFERQPIKMSPARVTASANRAGGVELDRGALAKPAGTGRIRRPKLRRSVFRFNQALAAFDVLFLGLAALGWFVVLYEQTAIKAVEILPLAAASAIFNILCLFSFDAYNRGLSMVTGALTSRAIGAICLSTVLLMASFLSLQASFGMADATRESVLLVAVSGALSLAAFMLSRAAFRAVAARGYFARRTLVVGSENRARYLRELMERATHRFVNELLFVPETVLDDNSSAAVAEEPTKTSGWEGMLLEDICSDLEIDEIVVSIDEGRKFSYEPFLACKINGIAVASYDSFIERETKRVDLNRPDLGWLVYSNGFRLSSLDEFLKRTLDIAVSFALLLISAPVTLIAIAAVVAGRDGPIFFKQQRVTKDGQIFWLYKIRTMRPDAERNGPQWSSATDSRVTWVGAILRRFRIDEIPQLLNVLKGDMSLVGPRPEQPFFVEQLSREIHLYGLRHSVKAGITGWAQINYPYGATTTDAIRKLEYELYYIKNYSFLQELSILLQTVRVLFWQPRAH